MEQVPGRVVALLKTVLKDPAINESAELGKTEGWDSLHHIRVILALENEFQVKISQEQLIRLTSVPKIIDFLAMRTNGN